MHSSVDQLPKEVKDKLLAYEKVTERFWDMATDDPEFMSLHSIGKRLRHELICHYGLSPDLINDYTYGEGGIIHG